MLPEHARSLRGEKHPNPFRVRLVSDRCYKAGLRSCTLVTFDAPDVVL